MEAVLLSKMESADDKISTAQNFVSKNYFHRSAIVLLTITLLIISLFSVSKYNINSIVSPTNSRKLSYIPPAKGEYTDYSHEATRAIPETTTRGIIQQFLSTLTSLTPGLHNDVSKTTELTDAIDKYEKLSGGYDSTLKHYKNSDFQAGVDALMHGTFNTHSHITNTWRDFMQAGTRIRDLVYVVIVTGDYLTKDEWLGFLEKWRFVIESLDLIIIQQGDPSYYVEMPTWAEYLLYNREDMKRCMGADAWIFDLEHRSNSARTFGTMLAHREFVYFLDDTMTPSIDPLTGKLTDPIEEHLSNVLRPSTPYYFNPQDPFRHQTDFVRGHPYTLREGVPTAMSQGHVLNDGHVDSLTRLMRPDEVETTRSQAALTIPHGTLFSLSAQNLLVYAKMASPCLYFAGPSVLAGLDIGEKNSDILTGWICKLVIDRVRGGVKYGGASYVNSTISVKADSLTAEESNKLLFQEFQKDLVWGSCCLEDVARFFADLQLTSNPDSASLAVLQVAEHIREKLGPIHEAFNNIARALTAYIAVWDKMHSFHTLTVTAIASRSSYRIAATQSSTSSSTTNTASVSSNVHQVKSSTLNDGYKGVGEAITHTIIGKSTKASPNSTHHNCAAFTIVRPSEPVMLPVWLRHYSRHFPDAIFVFRHILNVTEAFSTNIVAHDAELQSLAASAVGRVKFDELYGHPHGFAVNYLAHMGSVIADRLLRAGFSCVVYTDVDELIAPDPLRYPLGLAEYVSHFVHTMPNEIIRAVGHVLAHVSESEDAAPPLEKPIDWNKSILAQRSYWTRHHRYDKPLLTKIVARWKPGFHTAFLPAKIDQDPDLHLFHLTDVDRDFCIDRERQKFYVYDKLGAETMKNSGQNNHIKDFAKNLNNGQLCKLAKSFQIKSTGQVMDFKKTVTLDKMDPAWATVEM